jgi:hypothetical protein
MKRILPVVLIIFAVAELSGCEAIQRKFTRKRKRTPIAPRFYQEGEVDTRPNLELYMMHYMYWKTWHEELVAKAGENSKRDRLATGSVLTHLEDMKKYLVEEKAAELEGYIEQVREMTRLINSSSGSTDMKMGYLRQRMDNIRARIIRNFYYKKVMDHIKPD